MIELKFRDYTEKLDYSDVLIVPRAGDINSRSEVTLGGYHEMSSIPIIAANMDGVGTFEMAKALDQYNMYTALNKHYSVDELLEFFINERAASHTFYSTGINPADLDKLDVFMRGLASAVSESDYWLGGICVDVANGYSSKFVDAVSRIRESYPNQTLMVGNVVTPEQVEVLGKVGADIIKVGIGPGSVCTTRKLTGVGYPQLSAVLECAETGYNICADGGITCPGDVAKAFAAGARHVMIGGMFAGHEEGLPPGHRDKVEFMSNVPFYGMASKAAQVLHNGGVAEYRASEGKEVMLKYKGSVDHTVNELLGGLRSACTYVGARNVFDLYTHSQFVRVNRQLNNIFGAS